jgi:hypothetical protein
MQLFSIFFLLTLVSFVFASPIYNKRSETDATTETKRSRPFIIHKGLPFQNDNLGFELATSSNESSSSSNSVTSSSVDTSNGSDA